MTEDEAHEWVDNMRQCLREDRTLPANVKSHLNEVHRFLIEFSCPQKAAAARQWLIHASRQEAGEVGLDDPIPGVKCQDCED